MNTIRKSSVIASIFLFAISLTACSDQLVQEAIFRTLGETYRAQQMQAVTPGGQFQTGFAASIFEQLAEAKRQQRSYENQYARQFEEQARREQWQKQVMKARAETETVLLEDRRVIGPWIDHFTEWTEFCKLKVPDRANNSYCKAATLLLTDTRTFERRIDFYLTNLPAYFHANMDTKNVQVEIDDYLSKGTQLKKDLGIWTKAVTELQEAQKKEQEHLRKIEAEKRAF